MVGVLVDVDVDLLVGPVRCGGGVRLQPVLRQPVAAAQPYDAANAAEAGRVVRGARQAGRGAQRRGEERGAAARRAAPPAVGRGGGRRHRGGLPGAAVEVGPHARLWGLKFDGGWCDSHAVLNELAKHLHPFSICHCKSTIQPGRDVARMLG